MFNQYEKLEKAKEPLTLRVTLPMKVLLTSSEQCLDNFIQYVGVVSKLKTKTN